MSGIGTGIDHLLCGGGIIDPRIGGWMKGVLCEIIRWRSVDGWLFEEV